MCIERNDCCEVPKKVINIRRNEYDLEKTRKNKRILGEVRSKFGLKGPQIKTRVLFLHPL